jgi:hypothetical protein
VYEIATDVIEVTTGFGRGQSISVRKADHVKGGKYSKKREENASKICEL